MTMNFDSDNLITHPRGKGVTRVSNQKGVECTNDPSTYSFGHWSGGNTHPI